MANSNNGCDNGSYEGNSSLHAIAGPSIPPPVVVATNNTAPDPTSGTNTLAPALDQIVGPVVMNPLFCELFPAGRRWNTRKPRR
ncbi:UNVERIFIED_CONTAM: hypothetical protein Sangu_3012000 [Sesamum angustifolium]|uniref:Uncharacterized protein n=1 Tax=Sesamum angustifolium TaxID=2727405 RepID=A0AAW2KMN5_9LAMI